MKNKARPGQPDFYWRAHDSELTQVRVWRSDWFGDQFEVMGANEFQQFQITIKKFGFALIFKDIEED